MDVWVAVHCWNGSEYLLGAGDSLETALSICQRFIQKRNIPALLLEPECVGDGQWMVRVQNKDRRHFEITRLEVESLAMLVQYNQDSSSGTVVIEEGGN